MPGFRYTALDAKGGRVKGVVEAETPKHARSLLRERKLTPLEVLEERSFHSPQKPQSHGTQGPSGTSSFESLLSKLLKRALPASDLMLFTRQLSTLISSGSPLSVAFSLMSQQSDSPQLSRVSTNINSALSEGKSLSVALLQSPLAFPREYVATIAAAEESGHMLETLSQLAEEVELSTQSRQKLLSALTYPLVMSVVSLGIVVMMMIYVVPQVVDAFSSTGGQLPLMTRVIMGLSNFLIHYGLYFVIVVLSIVLLFTYQYLRSLSFRFGVHKRLLGLPAVGPLIVLSEVSRWARSLSLLLRSGVPTLQSFEIASEVVTNLTLKAAMKAACEKIREGRSVSSSLSSVSYLPAFVIHMSQGGEASGHLDQLMLRVSEYYEHILKNRLDVFLRLFEPALILIMGGVVLVIVLAILLPILQMNQLV